MALPAGNDHTGPRRDERPVPHRAGPTVVVFDLGGVLVQHHGIADMAALCGGIPEPELWRRWLTCPWVRDFERGRCDAQRFADGVVGDWRLDITPAAFLEAFRTWPGGLDGGAADLVAEVRARTTVACLSNTNALHWDDQIGRGFGLDTMFDHTFLSYEIDLVKPDLEVYTHVRRSLQRSADELLFLDDNQLNVDGARAAGWRAERVRGVAEARRALAHHGVLPTR